MYSNYLEFREFGLVHSSHNNLYEYSQPQQLIPEHRHRGQVSSMTSRPTTMPSPEEALPGREEPTLVSKTHVVNGNPTVPPFPDRMQMAMFAMGCYWRVEKIFWNTDGVYSTQVGFSGGYTKNPTYKEVCTGMTGHAEVVRVVFDPSLVTFEDLLKVFWENHDPTELNKQGKDQGTQYRSGIYYYNNDQKDAAFNSMAPYQEMLTQKGYGIIQTEILPVKEFYYAEDDHQQYLHKNQDGYCGLKGTGVSCPRPVFIK